MRVTNFAGRRRTRRRRRKRRRRRGGRGRRQPCKDRDAGRMPLNMKAEIRVRRLQASRHQSLPANHQKLRERHRSDGPSQLSEGTNPVDALISHFQPPEP